MRTQYKAAKNREACIKELTIERRKILDKLHENNYSLKDEEDIIVKREKRELFKMDAVESLNALFDSVCLKYNENVSYIVKIMALEDGLIHEPLED